MSKRDRRLPCLVHIPGVYPDGREIEDEKMEEFLERLEQSFGGVNQLGIIPGSWLDKGRSIKEPMHRIEVAVRKKDLPLFEKIARGIGKEMKQKAMYIVINYQAEAKFLFMDDEEGEVTGTEN